MQTHNQEIDLKLMKYRINTLKDKKGIIYLNKLASGGFNPDYGEKYKLSKIKQVSSIDAKTMKVIFEMEFVNE